MRVENEVQGVSRAGVTPGMNKTLVKEQIQEEIALQKDSVINKDKVDTVVSKLNEFIEPLRTDLKFEFHEKLNEYYVTLVNPITNETIKEIPPKKFLDMYADMAELMGLLIDEKI